MFSRIYSKYLQNAFTKYPLWQIAKYFLKEIWKQQMTAALEKMHSQKLPKYLRESLFLVELQARN